MKTHTNNTRSTLRIKSNVKAGGGTYNHNQTQVKPRLAIKSGVKAGGSRVNHNQTRVSAR